MGGRWGWFPLPVPPLTPRDCGNREPRGIRRLVTVDVVVWRRLFRSGFNDAVPFAAIAAWRSDLAPRGTVLPPEANWGQSWSGN